MFDAPPSSVSYTLSLHDALPISGEGCAEGRKLSRASRVLADRRLGRSEDGLPAVLAEQGNVRGVHSGAGRNERDRKSTRLNSSHVKISYAVFCLKKRIIRKNIVC